MVRVENYAEVKTGAGLRKLLQAPSSRELETLGLSFSKITTLPDSIGQLSNLKTLDLGNTNITTLPESIGRLSNLYLLDLSYCHLQSIPRSVAEMGLRFTDDPNDYEGIILYNTILEEGDPSLYLSNDKELIQAFYEGDQISEGEAIRECKVIFLGDGGVGKSSLIERIMEDTFALGKWPTDGMRVIPWETELDGNPFRLRFLDFGGQEIVHSMHRCFLSGHTVYVVVCDARSDTGIDAVAGRWLEQVKSYAPGCPVILALNKADVNPGISVNETNLKERFPGLKKVLKTSAAVEYSSEFYAGRLYDAIMDLAPSCVQALRGNRGMLTVKRALEAMNAEKKPYITSEEYQALCIENGIKTKKLQRSMLEWFRDLGVAYFYERDAFDLRLESLRVLDPVWLTNGIYRLILRAGKRVKNGVLTHEDIREVLETPYEGDAREDVRYSAEETEFVLHVIRMFEISHEMEGGRELIPMLMEKNAPRGREALRKDALHLRWEGPFLPNNVIHKLMIQMYPDLDRNCAWRTGGRFAGKGDCTALAEMNDDKSVDVYVSGKNGEDRRKYMDDFRSRVRAILHTLNLRETKEYLCYAVEDKEHCQQLKEIGLG